jgi:hypothetical protein
MDTSALSHVPALIAAYMRARASSRSGPFTIGLDAHSDDPMRNYAVPDHGACPDAGDIDALITFFRRGHRVPRLEYIEEDAPQQRGGSGLRGASGLLSLPKSSV